MALADPLEAFGVATDNYPLLEVERTFAIGFRVTAVRASQTVGDAGAQPAAFINNCIVSRTVRIHGVSRLRSGIPLGPLWRAQPASGNNLARPREGLARAKSR